MKVELLQEWLGHPAGEIIEMKEPIAAPMIARGAAKEVNDKQQKKPQTDKRIKEASTK